MKQYKSCIGVSELSNWKFYYKETSNGIYHFLGLRNSGNEVSCYGEGYDEVLSKCIEFSKVMERKIQNQSF